MSAVAKLAEFETRCSDWIEIENLLAWRGARITKYRIWFVHVNAMWFQRHEWVHANDVITIEPWVNTDLRFPDYANQIEYSLEQFMNDAKKIVNKE